MLACQQYVPQTFPPITLPSIDIMKILSPHHNIMWRVHVMMIMLLDFNQVLKLFIYIYIYIYGLRNRVVGRYMGINTEKWAAWPVDHYEVGSLDRVVGSLHYGQTTFIPYPTCPQLGWLGCIYTCTYLSSKSTIKHMSRRFNYISLLQMLTG